MTSTLKKQLALWLGGALICVVALQGANVLAQPEEKLTANEASRRFGLWVSSDSIIGLRSAKMTNLLTRQNQKDLDYYQLEKLLVAMTEQYAAAGFESRVVSDKSGKAIVRLIPLKDHPGKEVVCVKENGGYKIDLIETYGRWNKLSGAALAKRIYDLTGAVLPAMPLGKLRSARRI